MWHLDTVLILNTMTRKLRPASFVIRNAFVAQDQLNTSVLAVQITATFSIQPVLKHAQMDIMLTVTRDGVPHATVPVLPAMESTAHSAFPANQAGTDKEKDV